MKNKAKGSQSQSENSLFRKEVLQRKKSNYLGKTIIIAPISFLFWSIGIFIIAVALVMFLCFGKYTKRQEVHGILAPNKGLVNIYPEKPGIVIEQFIQQGDEIKKGQLLYSISTEQHTLTDQSLPVQQIASLEKQIEMQKSRITVCEKDVESYKQLLDQRFVSEAEYRKHYDSYLSAKLSLHDLEYRLSEVKGRGDYAIRAPADGTVAALTTMIGDRVTERNLLISIIPKGAELQGTLYVPTDAIGFIKPGQKVLLKYQAYPYQQFGLYESIIYSVDKSILSPEDIRVLVPLKSPFYRVIVSLRQQTVTVYGEPYPLVPGMLLEAIILGEEHSIWQWIMRPIYSLKGSLTS